MGFTQDNAKANGKKGRAKQLAEKTKPVSGVELLQSLRKAVQRALLKGGLKSLADDLYEMRKKKPGVFWRVVDKVMPNPPRVTADEKPEGERDEEGVRNGKEWLDRYIREKRGQ